MDGNELPRNYTNQLSGKEYNLYLNHLHRCDFGLMFKRHEVRSKWNQKQDGGGNHNRTSDIEVLKRYFNDIPTKIEIIPEEHKVHLYGI